MNKQTALEKIAKEIRNCEICKQGKGGKAVPFTFQFAVFAITVRVSSERSSNGVTFITSPVMLVYSIIALDFPVTHLV